MILLHYYLVFEKSHESSYRVVDLPSFALGFRHCECRVLLNELKARIISTRFLIATDVQRTMFQANGHLVDLASSALAASALQVRRSPN